MQVLRIVTTLAAVVTACALEVADAHAARPNVVIVLTDDQRADGADRMPAVRKLLARHGITFENAFVSNSLCCPSRTTLLTGRYSHTTGVWSNRPPFGSWSAFRALGAERRTIAVALQRAGYRTGYVGKYLNAYTGTTVPPGWDDWRAFSWGWGYFDYTLNVNGALVRHGHAPRDYSTDVLGKMAARFIRGNRASGRPFFLVFAPAAPHNPVIPAPRHAEVDLDLGPFEPPSVDEDLSDKPAYMRRSPQTAGERHRLFRLRQYRTLLAVDDAIARLIKALRATRQLRNTLVIFTSDNGVEWGEHGFPAARKSVPHEGSIRVPLIVRFGRVSRTARTETRLVTNADIAPTVAALAGVSVKSEGRSLVPLLRGLDPPWRRGFLVENLGGETASAHIPTYCGIRTERTLYVVYRTGERELYDLDADPYELENRAGQARFRKMEQALLRQIRRICFPLPPGFHPRPLCTLVGTAGSDLLIGGAGADFACLAGGHDRVATGRGSDTVDAGAKTVARSARAVFSPRAHGPRGSTISTGPGHDRILALNGRRDVVRCGAGRDRVTADRFDLVGPSCERIMRPGWRRLV
jgi:arylsulfatase A-like enzyme